MKVNRDQTDMWTTCARIPAGRQQRTPTRRASGAPAGAGARAAARISAVLAGVVARSWAVLAGAVAPGVARFTGVLAVALALAALPGAADGQQPRTQRVAIAEGDTVVVAMMGPATGPAVVVVPGLLGGVFSFRNVTPPLVQAGLRVVIVEPLGTGSSARPRHADYTLEGQARRIGHAMNAAGIRDAILLCHAVGGSMCYRFAIQSPERVLGIVAVNGGPDEEAASRDLRRAMRFAPIIRLVGGPGRARSQLQDGLRANSYDPAWVTDAILDSYGEPYGDFGATIDALSGMAAAREPQPLAPRLGRIQAPVRLLVGTGGDGGITRGEQLDVLRRIPDFQVTAVSGAGQYIHEERPRAVADAVLRLHRELMAANDR